MSRGVARLLIGVALALLVVLPAGLGSGPAAAAPTELFFSEYIEGSSNNKALEIYNGTGTAIDLAAGGYTVEMFFNGNTAAGLTIALTGTVAAGDVHVLAQASANATILAQADQTNGAGWFNGDDAVVLKRAGVVIDSIGQLGVDPGAEWGGGLTSTADNTLRRKSTIQAGDTVPTDAFDPAVEWDGFPQDTFDGLGLPPGGPIPDASPTPTATVTPTPVPVILPIGTVQGAVADTANGRTVRSPYAPASGNGSSGTFVTVQGVIYQKTLARTAAGAAQHGFFIQNTAATADGDPTTSDGIFVFMGAFTSLIGGYVPVVGDEVVLRARVAEFFNLTQLTSASLVQLVRGGVDLDAEVPAFDANPPDDLAAAYRYWERREGTRARLPAGSIVVDGRDVFAGTADAEVWFIRGDHPVAQRPDPYARRVFRDPHPLDNRPAELFDDGNGYRILAGSLGVKAASNDNTVLLAPARTFDTLTNAPVGGVHVSFDKYQIMVEQQLALRAGVDPARNAPPAAFDRRREYSVATYNVENLYDFRDDPFDGCDFVGNGGCPGVNPPFNYVPASAEAYQAHLRGIADQIISDLHGPDVILVQEAEDQDICRVEVAALVCGATDNADGRPDTLQELALVIAARGGPRYLAAYDRDGADDRGIVSAFLYRADKVELVAPDAADPVLGSNPSVDYRAPGLASNTQVQNPKALNARLPADVDTSTGRDGTNVFTRAPQVGRFRVWRDRVGGSVFHEVYLTSNHFSSTPDARVGQRTEQAAYNAAIADAITTADPTARVIVGGDLNVFPRPDDPFAPGQPLFPSDQLGPLYEAGLTGLWERLVAEAPASAYSYGFQGQAQTLDQIFVNPTQLADLVQVRTAHINADWPAEHDGDGPRGVSDHDPSVARFGLTPGFDGLAALVRYHAARGLPRDENIRTLLLERIARARQASAENAPREVEEQLRAFINQVVGAAPRFIDAAAAQALANEASLLAYGHAYLPACRNGAVQGRVVSIAEAGAPTAFYRPTDLNGPAGAPFAGSRVQVQASGVVTAVQAGEQVATLLTVARPESPAVAGLSLRLRYQASYQEVVAVVAADGSRAAAHTGAGLPSGFATTDRNGEVTIYNVPLNDLGGYQDVYVITRIKPVSRGYITAQASIAGRVEDGRLVSIGSVCGTSIDSAVVTGWSGTVEGAHPVDDVPDRPGQANPF